MTKRDPPLPFSKKGAREGQSVPPLADPTLPLTPSLEGRGHRFSPRKLLKYPSAHRR